MKLSKLLGAGLLVSTLLSCADNAKPYSYKNECGELKEYVVDKAYCQQYNLQETEFKVQYPAGLVMEDQSDYSSPNYVSFLKYDEDSIATQSVNIGYYYGVSESGSDGLFSGLAGVTKESLLSSIVSQFNAQGFALENVEMNDEEIMGEEHFTLRATFNHTNSDFGFLGEYLLQAVMIETEEGRGVLMIMSGRQGSEVNSYEDFETKTCLAPILQSFKDN